MTTRARPHHATTTTGLPKAVRSLLAGDGGRCGCTGQCEQHHAAGRCDADEFARLTVAPKDLTIPLEQAAVVPLEDLLVWCHRCRDRAEVAARRRRRSQLDDELGNSQLGLWGAS